MIIPRERLLRALNARPRRRGRPPRSVVPRLLVNGNLECPRCRNECSTPVEPNPFRPGFRAEKMILVGNASVPCPHANCDAVHWITEPLALAHNRFWFPSDPAFRSTDRN